MHILALNIDNRKICLFKINDRQKKKKKLKDYGMIDIYLLIWNTVECKSNLIKTALDRVKSAEIERGEGRWIDF